jgi:hypothetical protein
MDLQTLINIGAAAILAVIGWFARQLWDAVERLKGDIQRIEVCLPSHYSRKDDIQCRFDKIDIALEKLYEKLDTKVTKGDLK